MAIVMMLDTKWQYIYIMSCAIVMMLDTRWQHTYRMSCGHCNDIGD